MMTHTEKLCVQCHERPATQLICNPFGEPKYLCEICYQESTPPELLEWNQQIKDAIRNGKCQYCGAPATGGCGGGLVMQVVLWCEQCRLDLVEFSNKPENAIPDFPFDDEAAQKLVPQQLADHERRKGEFMRLKVLSRRSRK